MQSEVSPPSVLPVSLLFFSLFFLTLPVSFLSFIHPSCFPLCCPSVLLSSFHSSSPRSFISSTHSLFCLYFSPSILFFISFIPSFLLSFVPAFFLSFLHSFSPSPPPSVFSLMFCPSFLFSLLYLHLFFLSFFPLSLYLSFSLFLHLPSFFLTLLSHVGSELLLIGLNFVQIKNHLWWQSEPSAPQLVFMSAV